MNTEETAKKGYLIGDEDGMISEFHDAAVALTEEGEISRTCAWGRTAIILSARLRTFLKAMWNWMK